MFPVELQNLIVKLSSSISEQDNLDLLISDFRLRTRAVPAACIVRACDEIRDLGKMHVGYQAPPSSPLFMPKFLSVFVPEKKSRTQLAIELLQKQPELGHFYQFHGDGRIREAALNVLSTPPDNPFEFAAIAFRLNDWVGNVRNAAYRYAEHHFPLTRHAIVAEAAFSLLLRISFLSRWNDDQKNLLETTIRRGDVLEDLEAVLLNKPSGRVSRVLLQLLQKADFDYSLLKLSREAELPVVRAIALDALIFKRARWFCGFGKQWIDKTYGLHRRVALWTCLAKVPVT